MSFLSYLVVGRFVLLPPVTYYFDFPPLGFIRLFVLSLSHPHCPKSRLWSGACRLANFVLAVDFPDWPIPFSLPLPTHHPFPPSLMVSLSISVPMGLVGLTACTAVRPSVGLHTKPAGGIPSGVRVQGGGGCVLYLSIRRCCFLQDGV